jgi:hypothetical protein
MMEDPTPDELLEDAARAVKDDPPRAIPTAAGLPDDVRNGRIDEAPDEALVEHKEV